MMVLGRLFKMIHIMLQVPRVVVVLKLQEVLVQCGVEEQVLLAKVVMVKVQVMAGPAAAAAADGMAAAAVSGIMEVTARVAAAAAEVAIHIPPYVVLLFTHEEYKLVRDN
jgi:hypothetical protein